MPLALTTPAQINIVDTVVRIESFEVRDINNLEGPTVAVCYSVGTTVVEGEETVYVPRARLHTTLLQEDVVGPMTAELVAGSNIYAALKTALYTLLQQKGVVGTGSIS